MQHARPDQGHHRNGRQQDGQPDYTWTWTDGRKMHFSSSGKLDRITAATGEVGRLLYDSQNVLVRVIDPQGRSLNLAYFDRKNGTNFAACSSPILGGALRVRVRI